MKWFSLHQPKLRAAPKWQHTGPGGGGDGLTRQPSGIWVGKGRGGGVGGAAVYLL